MLFDECGSIGRHCYLPALFGFSHDTCSLARLSINELCRLTCLIERWAFCLWIFLQLFWFQAGQKRFILPKEEWTSSKWKLVWNDQFVPMMVFHPCHLQRFIESDSIWECLYILGPSTGHIQLRSMTHLEKIDLWSAGLWIWLNCWFMNYQPELVFHSRSTTQPHGIRTFEISNNLNDFRC